MMGLSADRIELARTLGRWARSNGSSKSSIPRLKWHFVMARGDGWETVCGRRLTLVTSEGERIETCQRCQALLDEAGVNV